jgi:pyrimidine deaminase RibD-like protein
MKDSREFFMRHAIALARRGMNEGHGGPFGAVVVRDHVIIGEGWNRVLSTNDPTAHGEICAIRDACSRIGSHILANCEIFTTGQPCPMCLGAIHWARISRIYYGFSIADAATIGFDDTEFFKQISLPPEQRLISSMEMLRGESLELVNEFAHLHHRITY